jgi:hypothetical protein
MGARQVTAGRDAYVTEGPGHDNHTERSSKQSYDTGLQGRLWAVSEDLTGTVFPV